MKCLTQDHKPMSPSRAEVCTARSKVGMNTIGQLYLPQIQNKVKSGCLVGGVMYDTVWTTDLGRDNMSRVDSSLILEIVWAIKEGDRKRRSCTKRREFFVWTIFILTESPRLNVPGTEVPASTHSSSAIDPHFRS